jgi:putative ABC transport system permease protein
MADIPEGRTEIIVFTERRDDAAGIAAQLRSLPELKDLDIKAWSERKPWSEMIRLIRPITVIFAGVIVLLTGLVVFNTMLMSVLERTGEIGVLRALGMNRFQTIRLFVTEAIGIALVGGLMGALLGGTGAILLEIYGLNLGEGVNRLPATMPINATVHGRFDVANLFYGMLLAFAMAIVGSLLPAIRATAVEPIEAIRQRR